MSVFSDERLPEQVYVDLARLLEKAKLKQLKDFLERTKFRSFKISKGFYSNAMKRLIVDTIKMAFSSMSLDMFWV